MLLMVILPFKGKRKLHLLIALFVLGPYEWTYKNQDYGIFFAVKELKKMTMYF